MTDFMSDPLAGIEEVIGPAVTDFPSVPDTYSPANRPQDIRYVFPERGTESHGVNDDTPTSEYFPNQTDGGPQIVTDDGSRNIYIGEELVPPDPVAVYEVPNPMRSIRRYTTVQTIFNGFESWSGSVLTGLDLATTIQISADETRVRLTFITSRTYSAFAGQVQGAWFAISTDPLFQQYIIFGNHNTASQPTAAFTTENCKESFYVCLAPIITYDPTKTNVSTLGVIQEYAAPIDHNPLQAD